MSDLIPPGHIDPETRLVKVSWSKVRTAEECRQKAYLLASGMKSPITNVRVFFQGNVIDQAMRQWLSMDDPPKLWMVDHVDAIMDELEARVQAEGDGVVRWKHRDDRIAVRAFCREAAFRLEPLLNKLVTPYEYQPAVRFSAPLTIPGLDGTPVNILLVGEMDLLVRERLQLQGIQVTDDPGLIDVVSVPDVRLRVWDLKVTKDASYWRKTVMQLVFYDIACICMQMGPTFEVGLIQPMVEGTPYIPFQVAEEDRTQMLTRIIAVAHSIMRGDVAPKASTDGCGYCEVRHACVKYQPGPGSKQIALF